MELLDKPVRRKKHPNYSLEFKRQLAQRASEPGVSVSLLAQENDINVNMLFKWRRHLREGRFDGMAHRQAMLPVTIVDDKQDELAISATSPTGISKIAMDHKSAADQPGMIEVQISGAVLRFDGGADLTAIRAVLGMLRL